MTREDAIKKIEHVKLCYAYEEDYEAFDMAIEALRRSERKLGRWIITKDKGDVYAHMRCSNCGQYWSDTSMQDILAFCPGCGAKMEEGE